MAAYILRRLALMIPTILGIMLISFTIIQFAPGGPVERIIAQLQGHDVGATARFAGGQSEMNNLSGGNFDGGSKYRGAQGLDPAFIEELEKQFGFDKPAHERFLIMIGDYAQFDFGNSFYRDVPVSQLIAEKLPVSISLGLWTTLITYLISIPLGIAKARRSGSSFDIWTSGVIIVGYAIPGFLFAVLLIIVFAGGSYFDLFPLRGLTSDNFDSLSTGGKIIDYLWHISLPVLAMTIGAFATTTLLTK
ncbi:MAG TPA: microcin ABC transporter permease, partial [Rhodobiaceae bacterium]|nr:microcin ABC transporter permease [Rhodobiaceae bacterium]